MGFGEVLFIATRMRALQMTDNRGAPQGWVPQLMSPQISPLMVSALRPLLVPPPTPVLPQALVLLPTPRWPPPLARCSSVPPAGSSLPRAGRPSASGLPVDRPLTDSRLAWGPSADEV